MGEKKKSPRMIKLEERAKQAGLGSAEFKRSGKRYSLTAEVPITSGQRRQIVNEYNGISIAEQRVEKDVADFLKAFPQARKPYTPHGTISLNDLSSQLHQMAMTESDKAVKTVIVNLMDAAIMFRFGTVGSLVEAWAQIQARKTAQAQ
jgi:hypothetical protein